MCGLFGFSSYSNNVSKQKLDTLINCLASESQIRGTQATGIACKNAKHQLIVQKESKAADLMNFQISKRTTVVIGHTRHATQGSIKDNFNNHPFKGILKSGKPFALAHNGVLTNDKILRTKRHLPKTKIETDSYIAVQLLEQHKSINHKTLKEMAEAVEGSFSFTVIDHNDTLYFVKGDSPLSVIHFDKMGLYVYASTDEILWRALVDSGFIPQIKRGEYKEIPLQEGQILSIDRNGKTEYSTFEFQDYYYSPKWWNACNSTSCVACADDEDYIENVKFMASYMGYGEEIVDRLLKQGFTVDDIENYLFEGIDGYFV